MLHVDTSSSLGFSLLASLVNVKPFVKTDLKSDIQIKLSDLLYTFSILVDLFCDSSPKFGFLKFNVVLYPFLYMYVTVVDRILTLEGQKK